MVRLCATVQAVVRVRIAQHQAQISLAMPPGRRAKEARPGGLGEEDEQAEAEGANRAQGEESQEIGECGFFYYFYSVSATSIAHAVSSKIMCGPCANLNECQMRK
jgi:hypothetical protein